MERVDIRAEHGEVLEEAEFRRSFKTVFDQDHSDTVSLYIRENLGMRNITKHLGRSRCTSPEHIGSRNNAFQKSGSCPSCKRAGTLYVEKITEREKS